jgi:hypothetical protein
MEWQEVVPREILANSLLEMSAEFTLLLDLHEECKEYSSSSSSSYICHGVGPPVDPFRAHVSRSLFEGLPRFLLPVGE